MRIDTVERIRAGAGGASPIHLRGGCCRLTNRPELEDHWQAWFLRYDQAAGDRRQPQQNDQCFARARRSARHARRLHEPLVPIGADDERETAVPERQSRGATIVSRKAGPDVLRRIPSQSPRRPIRGALSDLVGKRARETSARTVHTVEHILVHEQQGEVRRRIQNLTGARRRRSLSKGPGYEAGKPFLARKAVGVVRYQESPNRRCPLAVTIDAYRHGSMLRAWLVRVPRPASAGP